LSRRPGPHHRRDMREALQRDVLRHARREQSNRSFWHSLGVLGMVGWPIALMSVGGAFLGRYLDVRFDTGVHFTLVLITAGAAIGSYTAWRVLDERRK
jgi:ATP synthase protein I